MKFIGWWLATLLALLGPLLIYISFGDPSNLPAKIFCLVLGAWLSRGIRKQFVRQGGQEIADVYSNVLLAPEHQYIQVDAGDFTWLDIEFYERTTSILNRLGYDVIDDIEDLTISRESPEHRSFFRAFSSRSGETIALCSHLKSRGIDAWVAALFGAGSGDHFFIEFVSLASDYSIVFDTMNSSEASLDLPLWYDALKLASDTPVFQLHDAHSRRTRKFFSRADASPMKVNGYTELVEVMREVDRRKSEWRKQRGGITREELLQIGEDSGLERAAEKVADAMARDRLLGRDDDR